MSLDSFRQPWHLWGHILRAHAGPFFFSLFTLMFLFLLQFIMKFVDQLVGKGLSAWVITELIALNLAWMLVLAVPMSVLVATLMAFGDMSSKNEITAMKASGMSLYVMIAPVFLMGLIIGGGLVYFNNHVLPDANHELKMLTVDIRRKKPTLTLVNGVFSQDIPGYSILVRKTVRNTNDLIGVTMYDYTNPSENITITAKRGTISFSPDFRKLIMDLTDGEIHEFDLQNPEAYRRIRFEKHRIAMDVEGFDFSRSSENAFSRGDRELGAKAMIAIADSLEKDKTAIAAEFSTVMLNDTRLRLRGLLDSLPPGGAKQGGFTLIPSLPVPTEQQTEATVATYLFRLENLERQIDSYWVEIHKKYSIPAACIVFVLVGVPLGIMARRGGFGIAATLSLGFFVLYWACLIGGEKLADRDIVQPAVGMWIANVIIAIFGIFLCLRIGRETILIRWEHFQRWIPRRWRSRLQDEPEPDSQ